MQEAKAGRLSLLVMSRAGVFTAHLPESGEVIVGRSNAAGDVHVDDSRASRRHAKLTVGAACEIVDLGSRNGTLVAGKQLEPNVPAKLHVGDMVTIGSTVLVLQLEDPDATPHRVWSQTAFEERLEQQYWRVESEGASFAVVQVRMNDAGTRQRPSQSELSSPTSTNQEGIAKNVARAQGVDLAFRESLRSTDIVASYAPGSYRVLLVDTPAEIADALTQQLQAKLRERGFESETQVTCYPRDRKRRDAAALPASGRGPLPGGAQVELDRGVMQRLAPVILRVAAGNISVLILGETGVGKEVMARTLHERSPRSKHPLLCLNCAALSESLLESELFGYERGAFTGAVQAKAGLIESAQGGTVFLDEIGEMPVSFQAKLLRVLEQREVLRVGSLKPRSIDVRFIAATNRNLEAEIAAGRFRQDLYFRLNGISMTLPPLRERTDEIEALAEDFVERAANEQDRRPPSISSPVLELLKGYAWPGNIRELRNMMERAVILCAGNVIDRSHLPPEKFAAPAQASGAMERDDRRTVAPPNTEHDMANAAVTQPIDLNQSERERIILALESCAGNQTQAAKLLGISRRTLVSRLGEYALPRPRKSRP